MFAFYEINTVHKQSPAHWEYVWGVKYAKQVDRYMGKTRFNWVLRKGLTQRHGQSTCVSIVDLHNTLLGTSLPTNFMHVCKQPDLTHVPLELNM